MSASKTQTPNVRALVAPVLTQAQDVGRGLNYELRPMLRALELLTGMYRVLDALDAAADMNKDFGRTLYGACPYWRDTIADGDALDAIVGMTRVCTEAAARLATDADRMNTALEQLAKEATR